MKILIGTESYTPNISGVAVFTQNLARKMARRGHKVYIIAPSPKFKKFEENDEGIKIFRVSSKVNRFRQGYFISKNVGKEIPPILEEVSPDIVHLQDPAMISLTLLRLARKKKIPVVVTNHFSLEYIVSYLPLLKIIHPLILIVMKIYLNWFYNQCQVLTCPTKTIAKQFKGPITRVTLKVISNGVDLSRFMPYYGDSNLIRRRWKVPKEKLVVLYVGRLDVDKNVEVLIKAIPLVLKKTNVQFVVVGGGTEKENLIKLVKELKIQRNLSWINFIPYDDRALPRIYQTSKLFVNPCPRETQSIVVLEALATGLPVVVANSGALPELVEDGINGFLFEPGNSDDLAKKITEIIVNRKLSKKMGERSLIKVESHLVEETHDQYEKIYKNLARQT